MINRIIDWSARNKIVVLVLVAFGCALGWWSMTSVPMDAIPDQSDAQAILISHWDSSPDAIEDQVTYPIVTAMLGSPGVKTVRGISDFGSSYVYVIFEEGVDRQWARAHVIEKLADVKSRLPNGATTEIGPDASVLGWIYQYTLVDTSHRMSLAELRSYQDWHLRYALASVPGVAEVAPIGGFVRQYQVNVDPNLLQAYGIPLRRVVEAVRGGSSEAGGRTLEFGGGEFMVRGRGTATTLADFESIVLSIQQDGSIVQVKDIGRVGWGPEIRRGVADLNGTGEVVSGVVIMRSGENVLQVVDRIKARIRELEPGLPQGVRIVPVYDRSLLIRGAIRELRRVIVEVLITIVVIVLVFLWHLPSAIIPLITLPVTLLLCFIPFRMMGLSANIMSLAGVAIAFGELIDASIIVVEQTHKKLEAWDRDGRQRDHQTAILAAIKEVAGPTFFALLVIAVSFLPVLTLQAQEGRLFRPLAYSKTLAMIAAAILAITLDPALRMLLTRVADFRFRPLWLSRAATIMLVGRIRSQEDHPLMGPLMRLYQPVISWSLRWKWTVLLVAISMMAITVPLFLHLGSELMPPLDEGSILYMPSTLPGISIAQAKQLLTITDGVIKSFPEVDLVLGKAGRAETATDPAPLSMLETVITLKPKTEWRRIPTWYSGWAPEWSRPLLRHVTADTLSPEALVQQMDQALVIPGLTNSWNMPIKARNDMLSTGIRTPLGLKVTGVDVKQIQEIATKVENLLAPIHGTRSVFAERINEGRYIDVDWNRQQLAHYGLGMSEAQEVLQSAIGGEAVATTVAGRERYSVSVRYMRDFRSDLGALARIRFTAPTGQTISLGQIATVNSAAGPSMLRDENGQLTGYVLLDVEGVDPGHYMEVGNARLKAELSLPLGYAITWSGQYEAMARAKQRLKYIIPITLLLVFFLIFMNSRSLTNTMIVLLAVPFSGIGAIWFLYFAGYHMSVAVWVGMIALLGVDAETGMFMLLYLDLSYEEAKRCNRLRSLDQLREAIIHGAAKRLRPKLMTFATTSIGLVPILWATGAGSDVLKRIAAPMIGGILTSFLLELLLYPAIYELWKWHTEVKHTATSSLHQIAHS